MKIVIAGNYGAGNIGDEMILKGLLETIKNTVSDAETTVLSGNPEETNEKFKVNSAEKFPSGIKSFIKYIFKSRNKTRKAVKECDFFILGGGGLFGDLTFRANIIWAIQAFMAYLHKKPVIMYGQSIGEIKGKIKKWVIKKIFKKAILITVRDEESKENLKKLGVKKVIYVIPDLAFSYDSHKENTKRNGKKLLVALRQIDSINESFIRDISVFLNWIVTDQKWKITFMDFQAAKSKDKDAIIHEKIIKNLQNKDAINHIKIIKNTDEVFEEFSKSEMILGMRLHSIISAIKTNTPFMGISYDSKINNFLNGTPFKNCVIDMGKINFENLKLLFKKVIKEKKNIIKEMKMYNEKALAIHKKTAATTLRNILLNGR